MRVLSAVYCLSAIASIAVLYRISFQSLEPSVIYSAAEARRHSYG